VTARSALTRALLAPAVLALASCGGGTAASGMRQPDSQAREATGRAVTGADLATQLGVGFRRGLYQLAVMSQPDDEATDLGQKLPTGKLRDVHCRPTATNASTWACAVRWETVDGRRTATRYRIDVTPHGCFYGSAQPPLPQRYDATIGTYSEHPLNAVRSSEPGC
jgi:hypothetical protein